MAVFYTLDVHRVVVTWPVVVVRHDVDGVEVLLRPDDDRLPRLDGIVEGRDGVGDVEVWQ